MIYQGMKVFECPYLPYLSCDFHLSNKVDVSDKFRAEYDRWLDDMFGKEVNCIVNKRSQEVHVSSRVYNEIKILPQDWKNFV